MDDDHPINDAVETIVDGLGCVVDLAWPFLWFFGVMLGIALLSLAFKMADKLFQWVDTLTIVVDTARFLPT